MFKFNNNQRICYLWSVCLNLKKELMDNSWIIHGHSCLKSTSTSGFSYLWSLNTNYHELSINYPLILYLLQKKPGEPKQSRFYWVILFKMIVYFA